jgi:DNA-binding transcriptional regulator YdaS (Cro superfamily)
MASRVTTRRKRANGHRPDPGWDRAIRKIRKTRGLSMRIAEKLGIRPQAVHAWRRVPITRVLDVERITGLSRHYLRPEIYPTTEKR